MKKSHRIRRNIPLVDLKAGYKPLKQEIMKTIREVLQEMNLSLGPHCEAFEEEFALYCKAKYAIGVGSGTEAILFALLASGIGKGHEVITSPNTFFATAEAVIQAGAQPVFVDIDPGTYTLNPDDLEKKISKRTKAIIPVHMYGQAADMSPVLEIAERYRLSVIEDACQAHGALYKGQKAGSMGDAGCFSFYCTKNLGGYGEGGMVVTNNAGIAEKIKLYRNHGQRLKYEHTLFGYNGRLDEMQAAILRVKLKHLEEYNERRRKIAQRYAALLKNAPLMLPREAPHRKHVYHLYVVRCDKRDALREYLTSGDIGTGIHYKIPIHLQEAAGTFGYEKGDFPHTEKACSEILSLPMYPELNQEDQRYIAEKIQEFYHRHRQLPAP